MKIRSEKGFTLVEVLVAVALLAIIGIGLLTALGSASKVLLKADTRETARDLAQAQMEYIQNYEYNPDDPIGNDTFYPQIADLSTLYPGFEVKVRAARVDKGAGTSSDTGLQQITIIVSKGTETIFTLEGMKVNRE